MPYEPPSSERVRPTPVPQRTLGLYSLTPQAGTQPVGSGQTEEPTTTPEAEPEPTPTPEPTPESLAAAPPAEPEKADEDEEVAPAPGSGCFAPAQSAGVLDLTGVAVVAGLAFLGVRRRVWTFRP